MPGKKIRLDALVLARELATDLPTARALVGAGRVLVDGITADKVGSLVASDSTLSLKKKKRFVSRAGEKLAAAIEECKIDPTGFICVDVGASTGGFTDCLLQNGARLVYSVDVGYGLLDWQLRQDARVVVLERTNARNLSREHIPEPIDLAVIDASFISLTLLIEPLLPLFRKQVRILALVKPQFELPRNKVARGGVVTDPLLHREAVSTIEEYGTGIGLVPKKMVPSPVKGTKGNQEFVLYLEGKESPDDAEGVIL